MKTMKLCNLQYEKRSHQGYVYDQKPYPGGGGDKWVQHHTSHFNYCPAPRLPLADFTQRPSSHDFHRQHPTSLSIFCRHPASVMHCPPFAYPNNLSLVYGKKNSQRGVRDRDLTVPLSPHLYQTYQTDDVFRHFRSV